LAYGSLNFYSAPAGPGGTPITWSLSLFSIDPSGNGSMAGTLSVNEVTSLTTTNPSELTMQETGDFYGTSQLILQDRTGSNGALFTQTPNGANPGVNLVDFGFKPARACNRIFG